ncbi:MAG TPA: alanine racemase, partial [Acidimicrobiales bacterium]|nr:alanine racemase [Acidimicrobiales bacterium]
MTDLAARLDAVWERIAAAGGSPERVTLVAVTKGHGVDVVREALAAGQTDLGESYAQELLTKVEEPGPRWHFVGRIQTNKVRTIAPYVALWHGVDRASAGREIARRAPGSRVLVQVNVTGEATKAGCTVEALPELLETLRGDGLDVRGLMTIAPLG